MSCVLEINNNGRNYNEMRLMLLLLLFFCTPSIIAESRAPCLDKLFKIRD